MVFQFDTATAWFICCQGHSICTVKIYHEDCGPAKLLSNNLNLSTKYFVKKINHLPWFCMHNHTIWFLISQQANSTKFMCRTPGMFISFCGLLLQYQTNKSIETVKGPSWKAEVHTVQGVIVINSAYSCSYHFCHWIALPLSTGSCCSNFTFSSSQFYSLKMILDNLKDTLKCCNMETTHR